MLCARIAHWTFVIKSLFEIQCTQKICRKERNRSLNLMATVLSTYRRNEDKRKAQKKKDRSTHYRNYRSQSSHVFLLLFLLFTIERSIFFIPFNFHGIYTRHFMQSKKWMHVVRCLFKALWRQPRFINSNNGNDNFNSAFSQSIFSLNICLVPPAL